MNVTIIGAGYVGLPTGVIFAELGHTVWIVRRNKEKVALLKQGKSPIYEPGLEELIRRNLSAGRLFPTTSYSDSVSNSDVVFICVGTPQSESGEADLFQVFEAAREIARNCKNYTLIVIKSTVPVGTGDKVREVVSQYIGKEREFDVASCPEFLRESTAVSDALNPDRIVIGADSKRARDLLLALHQNLPGERVVTGLRTAEIIKYASNAMLSTQISFINMLADLCERAGADVTDVARAMRLDKRIGKYAFLDAGLGYGGGCFPKDIEALIHILESHGCYAGILQAVQRVNQTRSDIFLKKIIRTLGELEGKVLGLWGLTFKPNTDDLRQSPALAIVKKLLNAGAKIKAYDPVAEEAAYKIFPELQYCDCIYDSIEGADSLVIATAWQEFERVDLELIKQKMKRPLVFDGRNIFDPRLMMEKGFEYYSIGR